VRKMPESLAYATFDRIADRAWRARGAGVAQLEKNLHRVVPTASRADLRELSHESMRRYFRYWCDAFRLPDWSDERIVSTLRTERANLLVDAFGEGNGVIVALCHMGNWDHAGAWGSRTVGPVTAVAERLKPERLFQKFLKYREEIGIRIYPLGTPHLTDILASDLREEGRIGCLLADRDLGAHGIDVEFFGEATRMPAGAANLKLRTGAPLIPATLYYQGRDTWVTLHEPIAAPADAPTGDGCADEPGYESAVSTMTQQIANAFQVGITNHPTDWHMMQPLWLADLDPHRLASVNARRATQAAAREATLRHRALNGDRREDLRGMGEAGSSA